LKFRLIGEKPKGTEKGVKLDSIRGSPYDNGGYMSNAGYILDTNFVQDFTSRFRMWVVRSVTLAGSYLGGSSFVPES
jgi:hypothetical protein